MPDRYAMRAQRGRSFEQREPHDSRIAAGEVRDEHRTETLDGVRPGLAARFAAGPVGLHLAARNLAERDLGCRDRECGGRGTRHAYAGIYLVRAPGEQAQHPDAVVLIERLLENVP